MFEIGLRRVVEGTAYRITYFLGTKYCPLLEGGGLHVALQDRAKFGAVTPVLEMCHLLLGQQEHERHPYFINGKPLTYSDLHIRSWTPHYDLYNSDHFSNIIGTTETNYA